MDLFHLVAGVGPIVSAAIHNGHHVRPNASALLAINAGQRLREEDPYTDLLAEAAPTRLIGQRSRFEFDLNRPRDKAVYQLPEDAWGLRVWKQKPAAELVDESLSYYDMFFATAEAVLRHLVNVHGRVVVLDIHAYNHRRDGPDGPLADEAENPEVNVGTGTMVRDRWAPVVDGFIGAMREIDVLGRQLDVRENVKFRGGHFGRWVHETFPNSVCALAVEFKKTFMNEWTGEVDRRHLAALQAAVAATAPVLLRLLPEVHG